jgi:hypothetical protein
MRTSMAYFAGAGTVAVAIAAGFGGGLLIADTVSPQLSSTRLEQRMSSKPIPVSNAPAEPVQYIAGTQAAAAANPAQDQQQLGQGEASSASNPSPNAQPATPAPQPQAPATQTTAPDQGKASEQAKAPEDAFAKVRDADVKREARREDRRRGERRQQWAGKRHYQQRQDQEPGEVEQKAREDSEPRRIFPADPVRIEMPRIRLLGEDED